MIIKEIKIKNFRSYYGGNNRLALSEGLTLIIGDNGDGKTTLFEALEWLFDTTKQENRKDSHISEKRKSELAIGESDEVSVSITFEHDGEKEIEKCFTFERMPDGSIRTKDYKFVGYYCVGAERHSMPGDKLLDRCFESVIRKYCLFKGESELNVFDEEGALKVLVETFSGIKDFDRLVDFTTNFENKSGSAVRNELQKDKKVSSKAKNLNSQLQAIDYKIQSIEAELSEKKGYLSDISSKLTRLSENEETMNRCQNIMQRSNALRLKREKLAADTACNYSTSLLDEYWILRSFPLLIEEFSKKVSALSKEKRRLDKQETERRAKEAGVREVISEIQRLANEAVPLPWNVPDKETMQEMIDEERCKVCGRPAPKGSDAYEFMCGKLKGYVDRISEEANKRKGTQYEGDRPLFPNSFIDELDERRIRLSGSTEQEISRIASSIAARLESIAKSKAELKEVDDQLQQLESELENLTVQSGLSPDLLDKSMADFRGYLQEESRVEKRVSELQSILGQKEAERAKAQEELSRLEPDSQMTKVYQRTHIAFEKIKRAFVMAREENIDKFLQTLEGEANGFLQKLNENDFHGVIRIKKTINNSARIELYSDSGTPIYNPNGALKTTMYMSVLFAISRITTLKREQDYPLIFDAPTSSFGGLKEDKFYNVIDTIDKQCVIVTKDLLIVDKTTGMKKLDYDTINKLSCSVYRVEKVEPFDDKDLSTIQTVVTPIR